MSNLILVSSYYPQQNSNGNSTQTASTSLPSSDYSALNSQNTSVGNYQ